MEGLQFFFTCVAFVVIWAMVGRFFFLMFRTIMKWMGKSVEPREPKPKAHKKQNKK